MHIDVEQQVQQISANRSRAYEPEEIDWVLNKMQTRFIQSKMHRRADGSGGFELDQLDADSIRTLIVPSYDMVPYIDDDTRYKCLLPPDYSYLLSDWSYTTAQCNYDSGGNLIAPSVSSQTLYIKALRQDYDNNANPPFYPTETVTLGGLTIAIPGALPFGNNYTGYNRLEDVSNLVPFICSKGGYYWQRFENLYYPGYYIAIGTTDTGSPELTIASSPFSNIQDSTQTYDYHPGTGKYYDKRLTASNRISGLNSTAFYKSSYYSPVSELGNNILYVYKDSSFTVNKVSISYVRKPLPISISLNTDSDLPEEFHQQICDLSVEYILSTIKDVQGAQLKANDNKTRVVL